MKHIERLSAIKMRSEGQSIQAIARTLGVSKSSVSGWVRHIQLDGVMLQTLSAAPHTSIAIERRRVSRLKNEAAKRQVFDIYVSSVTLFLQIEGWTQGIFQKLQLSN